MVKFPEQYVAIDVEATGINPWRGDRMFSAAAAFPTGERLFWRDDFTTLREIVEDPAIDKVFHNAKYDWRMLEFAGMEVRGRVWDTMIFCHLLDGRDAGKNLALDAVTKKYLPPHLRKVVDEINAWFEANGIPASRRGEAFKLLPPALLKRRNVGDAEITLALFQRVFKTVANHFEFLLLQEHALLPVVKRMEDRGVLVDPREIEVQMAHFDTIVDDVVSWAEGVLGTDSFSLTSPADQRALLERAGVYDRIPEFTAKGAKTNRRKMDDRNLRDLHHPAAHMLIMGKAAHSMRTKFLTQAATLHVDGVLHANFNQLGTTSGRFSCSQPNLQNIPTDGDRRPSYTQEEADEAYEMTTIEFAPHLKRIFPVRTGYAHVHADKKSAEMVMLAHYTRDPNLLDIFARGISVHDGICMLLYGEMTKGLRMRTKAVTFGFQYGAGLPTLARKIGGTIAEAEAIRKRLARTLPSLPRWKNTLEAQVLERGYVETIHRRRHYLARHESYIAVNRVCQGTVGDEIKSRMVAIDHWLRREDIDGRIVLNIHDDLATELPIEGLPRNVPRLCDIMHRTSVPYALALPSSLDITFTRWSDLKPIDKPHEPSTYLPAHLLETL